MKFGRTYELSVETSDNEHVVITMPYTIEFDVKRQWLASANTSTIRIYNLGKDTRNRLYKDVYQTTTWRALQLRAGYENFPLPLIFNGNVQWCYSYRQGVDFVTEIFGYDGGFAMANGFSAMTLAAGQTQRQVLQKLVADLPNTYGTAIIGTFDQVAPRGDVLFGNSWSLVNERSGGKCTIDNGQVKILNDSEVISGQIPLISSETGLLGSPMRADAVVETRLLFEPRLTLGQQVELRSTTNDYLNGQRKVMGISHRGKISPDTGGEAVTVASLGFGTQALNLISGQPYQ